jgi:hypothetical protein
MAQKLSTPAFVAIIVVVLAVVAYFGYRATLAPPASTAGIGPGGKPMDKATIDEMAKRMSGGKYQPK